MFRPMDLGGRTIAGLLVDIDGVLYVGDDAIPGAVQTLGSIDVPYLYLSNTTTRPASELADHLQRLGFSVGPRQILTAPMAALEYLHARGRPPARLVLSDEVIEDFGDYPQSSVPGETKAVVIGDIGKSWSYALMDELFQLLLGGAELIALHKNRFWQTPDGLHLDIGAFVEALEYATGRTALVVGKPSTAFYRAALSRLKVDADMCAMIGDDIDSDVGGAQNDGILGVLVKTGKYREDYVRRSRVKPDLVLESIAELPQPRA